MFRTMKALIVVMLISSVTGCVASVNKTLPFEQLPEITLATNVDLVASPSHPNSSLPSAHVEAGETAKVIGTDVNAAWLLVLHNEIMGWMPSIFSQTNIGSLQSAVAVDPLSDQCTKYLGAIMTLDESWSSNSSGSLIVSGSLYHSASTSLSEDSELSIQIAGSGVSTAADYVHLPLTADDSVVLFTYYLKDIEQDTQVSFSLANADGDPLVFEAAFFKDDCPYAYPPEPAFVDDLPIGKIKTDSTRSVSPGNDNPPIQATPTGGPKSNVEVVTFQQRIPLTVTLFIPPGISGTHTISLPLDLDIQVRMNGDTPSTASAKLSDPSKPIAVPITTKAKSERARNQPVTHTPAPSQLEPGRLGPTEICGEISSNTTWEAESSPYIVTCDLNVDSDATLTLQAGVVVKFAAYTGLYINGALQILGTEELPVYFTSLSDDEVGGDTNNDGSASKPFAGEWNYVQFNARSDDENSLIEHLEIRYAGYGGTGAIRLDNASPTLQAISFVKNGINGAEITSAQLESDTWDNTDVVYVLRQDITIAADQSLTIVPGMVVKVAQYVGFNVDSVLQIKGTKELPVYFTSLSDDEVGGDTNNDGSATEPTVGEWRSIQFNARSDDENSLIEHLEIRYAGYGGSGAIRLDNASPVLQAISFVKNGINGAEITSAQLESDTWDNTDVVYVLLQDVTIAADQSLTIVPGMVVKVAQYRGLYVDSVLQIKGTEELPVYFTSLSDDEVGGDTNNNGSASKPFAGEWNYVQFNARSDDENSLIEHLEIRYAGYGRTGAIRLDNASPTLQAISFEKNGINGAEITSARLESDTWDNTDVVYVLLQDLTIAADQSLTIVPGMVVKVAQYVGFNVDSVLQIKGTEELPVYFTSLSDDEVGGDTNNDGSATEPTVGEWRSIQFNARSDDENSLIEHLEIRYAGYGGTGAVRLDNASPVLQAISFVKNGINGAEITSAQLESDTWDNTDVVYVLLQDVTVPPDQSLTIVSGMVVKVAQYRGLYVDSVLQIKGTEELPVYFTSLSDDEVGGDTNSDGSTTAPTVGEWNFIQFNARSDDENSLIEHLEIRYAGYGGSGAIRLDHVSPTLSNIVYKNNGRDEVEVVQ